jgi:hypothetical protein
MSSFTSETIRDLYEAYNSVYTDEIELFLNSVLDTVAESVNELVNEGYDLSDYSWDEIYESFLENVLTPELHEVESFITQLNESAEELTEEQVENLLQERLGFLSGLGNLFKGRQAVQTATQTATRAPKPSIIQAAPVKLGTTAPSPKPSSNPLYAPGVSSGRPTRPSVTPPPGADKGSFARFGDWLSSFTSKGRAQQAAKPSAPTQSPSPKPTATTPASRQPSGTPQRQQGWPSIGLRDTVGRVTRALTPGPRVKGVTKGLLKYGVAPTVAAVTGVGGLIGGAIDVKRAASGQSSVTQRLGGATVGGIGDLSKTAASVAAATPGIKDTGTPGELQQTGQFLKNIGSNIQKDVDVKRAKELRAQPPATSPSRPRRGAPAPIREKVEPIEIYNRQGNLQKVMPGRGYPITKGGKRGYVVYDTSGKGKFTEYPNQSTSRPPMPGLPPYAAQPGTGPRGNQVGSRPPAPPVPSAGGSGTGAGSRRPPAPPAPPRQPAPESPAVREYMKAAASARKSGDAAQMAKVRDTGLDIWRKKYANTLAKNVTPAGTQRGTGQSVMAKQADELRALRPAAPQSTTSTPEPQAQSKLSGGAYSPAATARMSQRTKNVLGVKEQYDAFDLVLEYLLSQGHVDTLEEALYVMMEMSSETVQGIVESPGEWFRGILNPNNSAASRAQNTSPFSRPTAPLPSYTSPFAKPASRTDSGKLTTYGAGGGAAAERSGQTRDQVMRQGAKNVENKNKSQANPGPNFGR